MPVERRERVIAIWLGSTGNGRNPMFNGRRQPSRGGTSRMTRECQVRFCERLGVKFPGPTRHFRQIEPRPPLSSCPLRSDRVRTFAPQRIDAVCQGTKSLRDSQRPRRLTATLSPGARSRVAGEAPCLEDRGVSNLSLKTGVAYDNHAYHPAASAYDRRYECAQALCWHAEGPHPQLQAVRGVSEAITRHGYMRGYPRLPAASGRHGDEHL